MANKHVMIVENSVNSLAINESTVKSNKLKLEGKFTEFDIENRNKRMYTADKFIPCMNLLLEKKKTLGVLYGEYDHPDVFDVTCKNLSHVIDNLTHNENSNCIDGSITLLNNSWGKEARSIIEDGYPLFVSSRAAGVTDGNGIVHLKELFTYDIVADPGFSSAKISPKMVNESLGYKATDEIPYRIYEMNDAQVNALFNDNKNDNKTKMDLTVFESFLQKELVKFESELINKIGSKKYEPQEVQSLMETIDGLKKEISDVNKVLELFRTKINALIVENTSIKEEYSKIKTEVNENMMHNNHLTSKLKSLSKYAIQIDERLNNSEGLLENVAKHTQANIYFSKDIASNLADTTGMLEYVANETKATQGLLEHVSKHVQQNSDGLLFVINENEDIKSFVEETAKEVEATQGLLEHTAKEAYNDHIWLNYIHEKVDGVIKYSSKVVEALKADSKSMLKESVDNTEFSKIDKIEDYLGITEEQELLNTLENPNTETEVTEPAITAPAITEVEPEQSQEINTVIEEPVQTEETPIETVIEEPVTDIAKTLLDQLVKIVDTDDTGVVIEITPENMVTIRISGSDDVVTVPHDKVEELDVTEENIVETVTNLVSEIKKKNALANKEPHFFSFLSEKQVNEFKDLDNDTQASIILLMQEKEYYNAEDVLNYIAEYLNSSKSLNREDKLVNCMPEELKESWNALTDDVKKSYIAESKYFPLKSENDMVDYWNTRKFAKDTKIASMITENISNEDIEKNTDDFMNAIKNLK